MTTNYAEKDSTTKHTTGDALVRLLKDYCTVHANSQGYVGPIERDNLDVFAKEKGLPIPNRDCIGTAKKELVALGFVKDIDREWYINLRISVANQTALEIVMAGGTLSEGKKAKRECAKEDNPLVEELYISLKRKDDLLRKEDKKEAKNKLAYQTDESTASEGRESWVRDAAIRDLGGVCQVTGEPASIGGKDNGVDAAHIASLELLNRWGFSPLNSPHNIRLLRADIHRRNDSGLALAKDAPTLKTPERFIASHTEADELQRLLVLLETKGTTL
jgi:hypothetical protein